SRDVFVPPSPITGTGPGRGYPPARTITPEAPSVPRDEAPGVASAPPLTPTPPAGLTPVGYPLPSAPVEAGLPGWLGFIVAPIALLVGELGSSEGTLCPEDSGLPIGP